MPSTSKRQESTMRGAAHNKEFAKKMDIPQKVAREYVKKDQAKAKKR